MRFTAIYITASRATSKTFLSILAKILQCIFIPGHNGFIVAPNKNQAAKIAKQKIAEIFRIFPFLEKEVKSHNYEKDYVALKFHNGSQFSVVGALDSDRGIRNHSGLFDELRDLDGEMVGEVILPQLNVSRRMVNGDLNPYECINQQRIFATSAGLKSSYAYQELLETFAASIIDPKHNFCIGIDWRIPAMHGLIDRNFVKGLKLSSSYSETTFAAEYMCHWLGGSEDSWFDYEKMLKRRKLKNPEWSRKNGLTENQFYLLSVDVGRLHDSTVCVVLKVTIKDEKYYCDVMNVIVLGKTSQAKTFDRQAIELKRLIAAYQPKEVVIDTNGLGMGLGDEMIKTQVDEKGVIYPAYGFFNNDDYKKVQPKGISKILYSLKANGGLNSQIHGNAYARMNNGLIRFLVSEQDARRSLLATKKGMAMTFEQRVKRLMPHEMTTKLLEEMANLKIKQAGLDIVLEQINTNFPKDKYSAFAYGLWRVKEIEDETNKKKRRRLTGQGGGTRNLVFYGG